MKHKDYIVVDNGNGTVAVVCFSPDFTLEEAQAQPDVAALLANKPHRSVPVGAFPPYVFRPAWVWCPSKGVRVDLARAKDAAHEIRRAVRAAEFAPLDFAIAAQLPGTDVASREAQRQAIREKHSALQTAIDAAPNVSDLYDLVSPMLEGTQ